MVLGDLETEKRLIDNLILIFKIIGIITAVALFVLFIWSKKNSKKIDIVKAEIAKVKEEKQEKIIIETNISIGKNKFDIQKLADEFRTFQQLDIQDKFESHIEQEYGLTKEGYEVLLSNKILNSKSQLDKGLAYYLSNEDNKAIPIFTELIKDTNPFDVRAISNSYLGRIEFSKGNLCEESLNYLLEAEKLFDKLKTEDEDVLKVRASNYYDLGFYYKTHTQLFELSQTYYLQAIEIYETINNNIYGTYSSKLAASYNDLYILMDVGNLKGNPLFMLQRAIFYNQESLSINDNDHNFRNYINSNIILGNYYRKKANYPDAIEQFEKIIQFMDERILKKPLDKNLKLTKAAILIKFGDVYSSKFITNRSNRLEEDLVKSESKLDLAEDLLQETTEESNSIYAVNQYKNFFSSKGTLFRCLNKYPQALKYFSEALRYNEVLISKDKNNIDLIMAKGHIFYEIANSYMEWPNNRNCDNAKIFAKKSFDIYNKYKDSRKSNEPYLLACIKIIEDCS